MVQTVDRVTVGVHIDNVEIVAPNVVDSISIINTNTYPVPSLKMTMSDTAGLVGSRINVVDGSLINITYGVDQQLVTSSFRVADAEKVPRSSVPKYYIEGYLNEPLWLISGDNKVYEGTTASAITQLAAEANLEVEADQTNDHSNWRSANKKRYLTGREWANHGYVDDDSIMQLVFVQDTISRPKRLRYKNLNNLNRHNPVAFFKQGSYNPFATGSQNNPYLIINAQVHNNTGAANIDIGYAAEMLDNTLDTTSFSSLYKNVTSLANPIRQATDVLNSAYNASPQRIIDETKELAINEAFALIKNQLFSTGDKRCVELPSETLFNNVVGRFNNLKDQTVDNLNRINQDLQGIKQAFADFDISEAVLDDFDFTLPPDPLCDVINNFQTQFNRIIDSIEDIEDLVDELQPTELFSDIERYALNIYMRENYNEIRDTVEDDVTAFKATLTNIINDCEIILDDLEFLKNHFVDSRRSLSSLGSSISNAAMERACGIMETKDILVDPIIDKMDALIVKVNRLDQNDVFGTNNFGLEALEDTIDDRIMTFTQERDDALAALNAEIDATSIPNPNYDSSMPVSNTNMPRTDRPSPVPATPPNTYSEFGTTWPAVKTAATTARDTAIAGLDRENDKKIKLGYIKTGLPTTSTLTGTNGDQQQYDESVEFGGIDSIETAANFSESLNSQDLNALRDIADKFQQQGKIIFNAIADIPKNKGIAYKDVGLQLANNSNIVNRALDIVEQVDNNVSNLIIGSINTINTPESYTKALFQNERGSAFNNNKVEFYTNQQTNVNLLDPIYIQISHPNENITNSPNTNYDAFILLQKNTFILLTFNTLKNSL